MLRIAEYNKITGEKVDLKELEKFGYFFDKKDNTYIKKIHKTSDYTYFTVYINLKNRRIEVSDGYSYSFYINDEDTEKYIDDLIQAGLVEKGE